VMIKNMADKIGEYLLANGWKKRRVQPTDYSICYVDGKRHTIEVDTINLGSRKIGNWAYFGRNATLNGADMWGDGFLDLVRYLTKKD
jgi:hypothetical protein